MTFAFPGRRLASVMVAGAALACSVPAQVGPVQPPSSLKRLSVAELLEVRVLSVTRTPEELGSVPSSIYLIPGDAARAVGATSLPEVLRMAPNLFVAQGSAYDWAVGARGFTRANTRVNKMQVLIDGRTVYSPLFSGVFWDAQDVFLPDLDRIEVISGPAGATWGANAVNGVISIATKSASDTIGNVVYAGLGDELEWNVGARHGGRAGASTAYRVYAKHRSYDGSASAVANSYSDAWTLTQAGFRLDGGDPRAAFEWTLQGDAYRGFYGSPTGVRARNEGANVMVRGDATLANGSELSLRTYQDYTLRRVPDQVWEYLRTSDVELQHKPLPHAVHQLMWGAHFRYMNEDVHFGSEALAILPVERDMRLGGVFVQDSFDVVPDSVRLTAGLRVEHNTFSDWELQPSVRIGWSATAEHTLWAAVSRATRTPSRIDTDFHIPAQPPYVVAGGPDFDSEVLTAFEIGWRGRLAPGVAVSATAYCHKYDKLRSISPGDPIVISNDVFGRSVGLEASLDWQISDRWRVRGGGFLLDVETDVRPGETDLESGLGESSDPDYQILLRSSYDVTRDLLVWMAFRHVGSVPVYVNGADAGVIPAYAELDATVRWQLHPGVEWLLIGRNLLHGSHAEIGETAASRREIERSVHTMIRWDF